MKYPEPVLDHPGDAVPETESPWRRSSGGGDTGMMPWKGGSRMMLGRPRGTDELPLATSGSRASNISLAAGLTLAPATTREHAPARECSATSPTTLQVPSIPRHGRGKQRAAGFAEGKHREGFGRSSTGSLRNGAEQGALERAASGTAGASL